MRQGLAVLTLYLAIICLPLLVEANTSGISRQEVQNFLKQPGNAAIDPDWTKSYQNKIVQWQGVVYKVSQAEENQPVEVLLRVLPSSRLYDTVLLVPPDHPWANTIQAGQNLVFEGMIISAVDTVLLREVQVKLYTRQPVASRF